MSLATLLGSDIPPPTPTGFAVIEAALTPTWEFRNAIGAAYFIPEVDTATGVETVQEVSLSEGLEFGLVGKPVGFVVGFVALQDEGESLPRLAPMVAFNLGGQRFRWQLGYLYDRHNVEERGAGADWGTVRI